MQTTKRHGRAIASVRESDGESEGGSGMSSNHPMLLLETLSFMLIVGTVVVLFFTLNYLLLALARVFS